MMAPMMVIGILLSEPTTEYVEGEVEDMAQKEEKLMAALVIPLSSNTKTNEYISELYNSLPADIVDIVDIVDTVDTFDMDDITGGRAEE